MTTTMFYRVACLMFFTLASCSGENDTDIDGSGGSAGGETGDSGQGGGSGGSKGIKITQTSMATVSAAKGAMGITIIELTIDGGVQNLAITGAGFSANALSGLVTGSGLTQYLSNILLKDEAGKIITGPFDYVPFPEAKFTGTYIHAALYPFTGMLKAKLVADLAPAEDKPGEFFGNSYEIIFGYEKEGRLFSDKDIKNMDTDTYVSLKSIRPNTPLKVTLNVTP